MSEPKNATRRSSGAAWTWTLAIACWIAGALFFPTPLPLAVPFISLGLLILAPRLPWARQRFMGLMETYPRVSGRLLKNPPKWVDRRLREAGISFPRETEIPPPPSTH